MDMHAIASELWIMTPAYGGFVHDTQAIIIKLHAVNIARTPAFILVNHILNTLFSRIIINT